MGVKTPKWRTVGPKQNLVPSFTKQNVNVLITMLKIQHP